MLDLQSKECGMRPPEISDQDIIQAGRALLAAGRMINGFALRTLTGGGKPERLIKVWEEHLNAQAPLPASLPTAELPLEMAEELAGVIKALNERLAALVISLNNQAVQAAERRVHQVQRSADEQSVKDKAALADAATVVDELQAKLSNSETKAEALEQQLAEAQALTEARTGELAQVSERLAEQERQNQQTGLEHAAELARLNGLLENERQSHEEAVAQQRAELREQEEKATLAREALSKDVATAKADAAAAKQALSQQKASDQERLDAAETKLGEAGEAASAAREQAARLGGQAETLQVQVTELMRVIATRLAVQDAKEGIVAGTSQADTTPMTPGSGSPVLQS
jgi:colicin import membrane protein